MSLVSSATRLRLLGLLAVCAALLFSVPAADARGPQPVRGPSAKGVCAVKAGGSLRPSPVRACRRSRKAPRALPAAVKPRTESRPRRKRSTKYQAVAMMGRIRA